MGFLSLPIFKIHSIQRQIDDFRGTIVLRHPRQHPQDQLLQAQPLHNQAHQVENLHQDKSVQHSRSSAKVSSSSNLKSLYNLTIKYPQYRAFNFAKLSNFSYSDQIQSENVNLALYAFGSLKYLLALMDGTLSPVTEIEFKNRLQHFEIRCLSSSLSDFNTPEWQISREYEQLLPFFTIGPSIEN